MKNGITTRLLILIILTGFIPLVVFGLYSIHQAKMNSAATVMESNLQVAKQASGRIQQYLENTEMILSAIAENINNTNLSAEQKAKILRNHIIEFGEFHSIGILDLEGNALSATPNSESLPALSITMKESLLKNQKVISGVFLNGDFVPSITMAIPIKQLGIVSGALVAEMDLLKLWKFIGSVKIGQAGFLNLITNDGKIFASGNGDYKILSIKMAAYPHWNELLRQKDRSFESVSFHKEYLVSSATVPAPYGWRITIEQPLSEAYAFALEISRNLIIAISLFVLATFIIGILVSRKIIVRPIRVIMQRVKSIGQGNFQDQINLKNAGEFSELSDTINDMSQKITSFQNEIIRKERQAVFGQVAAGIAHDLKHPVKSIENYLKLLFKQPEKPEIQALCLKTIDQELERIHRFLSNMHDLTVEIPYYPSEQNLNNLLKEIIESVLPELDERKIILNTNLETQVTVSLDKFSAQRLFTNFIRNAMEAMPAGGTLGVRILVGAEYKIGTTPSVLVQIEDNGIGISADKLDAIFLDFTTSKATGLGLGLAIAKKIIGQHHGDIKVESELGKFTRFSIFLPL